MCKKAVNISSSAIQFVPECYKTREMCDKSVPKDPFMLKYSDDRYKNQEMCDKAFSEEPFLLKICHDSYKTPEMRDKAVDDFPTTLKSVPDWFVTSKVIKNLHSALFADDNILFCDKDSGIVTFSSDEMSILSVDFNNNNLDDAILIKVIIKLLFMLDLGLGVID